jgi:hypothetical protein
VAGHAPRISARCEDARELSASARPRGSFLEKWKLTVSDQTVARGLASGQGLARTAPRLKAAKALGINVPLPILGRADEVIE